MKKNYENFYTPLSFPLMRGETGGYNLNSRFNLKTLFAVVFLFLLCANTFAVNDTVSDAGGNWSAAGTWKDGTVPDQSNDVIFTPTSGQLTVNVSSACKTFTTTGWTGTITRTSQLNIYGNCTISSTTSFSGSGSIFFMANGILTSNTVNMGVIVANVGRITLGDALTCSSISVTYGTGGLITNNYNVTTGILSSAHTGGGSVIFSFGSSQISCSAFTLSASAATTVNAGTSKITITGATSTLYGYGTTTFYDVVFTGAGNHTITNRTSGKITFHDLKRTGTAAHTEIVTISDSVKVTHELQLKGASQVYRILLCSGTYGTKKTLDITGATFDSCEFIDFRDILFIYGNHLNWTTCHAGGEIHGGSGNCLGDSVLGYTLTLTAGVNLYFFENSGAAFNTSDTTYWFLGTGGTGGRRIIQGRACRPLPQDNALFNDASFDANGETVIINVPRYCKDVTYSNTTRTGEVFTIGVATSIYGSLTFSSGVGVYNNTANLTFEGRSSNHTISANKTYNSGTGSWIINSIGGTYALSATLTAPVFTVTSGTFNDGNNNWTPPVSTVVAFTATGTSTVVKGGTWTFGTSSADAFWSVAAGVAFTDAGSIVCNQTIAGSKIFQGGGKTYNNISITNTMGTDLTFVGNNTIGTLALSGAAKTIKFTSLSTTTISTALTMANPASTVYTIQSSVAGSPAYISKASGNQVYNWLSLKDIIMQGGASWYVGNNSQNISGNSGMIFRDISNPFMF